MAYRIRRNSMEHLEIYDLDKLTLNKQLPPPLPPPREQQHHLPSDIAFERYQFLCDTTRQKTDPVYAATPMFKIIPQSTRRKYRRQVLGSCIPARIIKPIPPKSPSQSAEPESAKTNIDTPKVEQEEENIDEVDNQDSDHNDDDDDDDGDDGGDDQSSSSSSKDDNDDDDDNNKGVIETIYNRNKR